MFPPVIEGEGITLRAFVPHDAAALYAYLSRPEVFEATSSPGWDEAGVRQFVEANIEGMEEGRSCRYAIVSAGGAVAGDIGFGTIDIQHRRAEVGYHLAPEHWGRGIMPRAVAALLAWAFEAGFHRIEATVMEGNLRSERVLQKLGFEREATLRDYKFVRGEWRDFSLWSLVSARG